MALSFCEVIGYDLLVISFRCDLERDERRRLVARQLLEGLK